MNRNNQINNNSVNYGVDTGPHTVIHHQHYQMVNLLIQHCRRSMGGLNPYALPCVSSKHREKKKDRDNKGKQPNLAKSKQGWKVQKIKRNSHVNNEQKKEI